MKKTISLFAVLIMFLLPGNVLAADRVGVVLTNGDLYAKEGPRNAEWKQLTSGVDIGDFDFTGDYIGVVDKTPGPNANMFSVKEPLLTSTWNFVHLNNAKKTAISKLSNGLYRIVVLTTTGEVYMKDGVWNSGYWSGTVATGVKDIVVGGDNVGVIMTNNDFKAKQLTPGQFSHPNNASWLLVAQNVTEAAMTNDRVAVLIAGAIIGKDGGVGGQWYGENNIFVNATAVRLAGNKICAITFSSVVVQCKEGSLSADPVYTYTTTGGVVVSDFRVASNRFMALNSNGDSYVMDGTLTGNNGWSFVTTGNGSKIQLGE